MAKDEKLKIGLVFDDSLDSNDGVAQYVKTVGSWLNAQGHQVRYLVGQTKLDSYAGGRVYSLAKNAPVKFNGNKLSIPLPASKRKIRRLLAKEKFDVLHVMMPHSPFMAGRVIKASEPKVAIVGTFHIFPAGWMARFGGRLLHLGYGRSLLRFGQIVSVSSAAQTYAAQIFKISSHVLPNTIDTSKFADSGVKPIPGRIVFLGRLVKRKGARQLLEAFALLNQKKTTTHLIIAGDGPDHQQLATLAKKLGIESKVEFQGHIKESDKPTLLASAQIACYPSLYGESFGIVLLEAMAAGSKVVLGGDNPGYRSVLGEQPELLIKPNDTKAFADRLLKLLEVTAESEKLSHWQRQAVAAYDINLVGQKILDMYFDVIARQSKTSHNKNYGFKKGNG